jgi:hypothetical protein
MVQAGGCRKSRAPARLGDLRKGVHEMSAFANDYLVSAGETLSDFTEEKRSLFESDRKLDVAQVQALLAIAQRLDAIHERLEVLSATMTQSGGR